MPRAGRKETAGTCWFVCDWISAYTYTCHVGEQSASWCHCENGVCVFVTKKTVEETCLKETEIWVQGTCLCEGEKWCDKVVCVCVRERFGVWKGCERCRYVQKSHVGAEMCVFCI